jgi:hypothetical protein
MDEWSFHLKRKKNGEISGSYGDKYEDDGQCPDDGGNKNLWSVSKLLPDHMAQKTVILGKEWLTLYGALEVQARNERLRSGSLLI